MTEGVTGRRWAIVAVALAMLVVAGLGLAAFGAVQRSYRADLVAEGERQLRQAARTLNATFDAYRSLAPIYARDPRVVAALTGSGAAAALNRTLETWNALSGSSDTYVMNAEGTTVAASNWGEEVSFVGQNFSYRPYFREAMTGRLGRFFGLGTTSGKRGYYYGAPVRSGDVIVGVVAVKISVEDVEQTFRLSPEQLFVTDAAGVVILAGNPELRLTRLDEIGLGAQYRIARTRQFDIDQIGPAPITPAGEWEGGVQIVAAPSDRGDGATARFVHLAQPMLVEGWTMHVLVDMAPVGQRLFSATLAGSAVLLALLAVGALIWQRRRRLIDRLRERERARAVLELRVAERTAELSETNLRLEGEVAERRQAEATLRQTQSELIQAGKLAALGQMSAALSHEFNQPLTAIRTYSENAIAFYEAGAGERAAENLGRVMRLTERMAQLSKHLSRFARRSQDDVAPVDLDMVIDDALALLAGRLERAEAQVRRAGPRGCAVMGGAVRLQHVVMNLVGNALDAVREGPPEIVIAVTQEAGTVRIAVEDNGTGIPADVLPRIFDPFFTTKEVGRGLGLGLSISYNIVRDFGGRMRAENRPEGGARVTVTLNAAETAREAAE